MSFVVVAVVVVAQVAVTHLLRSWTDHRMHWCCSVRKYCSLSGVMSVKVVGLKKPEASKEMTYSSASHQTYRNPKKC